MAEVAHDLLQPTATISALAAMALLHDIPPAVRSCIQHIAAEARVSVDLCLGLIVESQAHEPVEVDLLVAAVARSAGVRHGITIDVISSPALVEGDPVTLRRTLDNVVENACRSAGSGGRVEVHVAGGHSACIEVHDSGLGFGDAPPGVASLGLGIVRRILAEHGGAMTIETSPLGGACVRLELPSAPQGERGEPVSARAVPRRR